MFTEAISTAFSKLRIRRQAVETSQRQGPPPVVNGRLYRRPPPNTPLDLVPNTRFEIRQLATSIRNFSKQVSTEAQSKNEYIYNVQKQLAEIRKLTFWDEIGILPRRLIDTRAYIGINVWEELKNSNSKLYVVGEREQDFFFELFEPRYPDIHVIYLTGKVLMDKIYDRKPIPEQSSLHKYLDSFRGEQIINRCNRELHGAFIKALDFLNVKSLAPLCYPGVVIPGIVVSDIGGSMSTGSYLGIEIDHKIVEDLISAIEEGSNEKIDSHVKSLESSFVYTLTHVLQNIPKKESEPDSDGINKNKIAPYITKFLYEASSGYDLSPAYILSFNFTQDREKEITLAMKALYSELISNEKVQIKPQNFRPETLMESIKQLKELDDGEEIIDDLVQKVLDSFSNDLFETASKVPDPEVKTIESIPYEDRTIEVISDGFLASNAVVTTSTPKDSNVPLRNIRLNEDIALALNDKGNENHATAKNVYDFAVSLAKKSPVNLLRDCGHKIDIYEYAVRRLQDKVHSELEITTASSNILQGVKKWIDSMITENKFKEVFNFARSIGMLSNIDETLICWDYGSAFSIQSTCIV